MPNNKILSVELIPSTCHYSNVRTTVKPKEWDKIRFLCYAAADNKCEICEGNGKEQGYKHNVECHEIWEYNDELHIQKLIGLIALCPTCHQVKHIGRAIAIGKDKECITQLGKVNNWTPNQVIEHIETAFVQHRERSQHQWTLNISLLNEEPYNLNLTLGGKRKFEKAKWKKKRKTRRRKKTAVRKRPKKK